MRPISFILPLFCALGALLLETCARAQIALQDGPSAIEFTNNTAAATNQFTVTAGAGVLVVVWADEGGASGNAEPTSLTWNGQTLTRAVAADDGSGSYRENAIYYRFNPTAGTSAIIQTGMGSGETMTWWQAYTLGGVTNIAPETGGAGSGNAAAISAGVGGVPASAWAAVAGCSSTNSSLTITATNGGANVSTVSTTTDTADFGAGGMVTTMGSVSNLPSATTTFTATGGSGARMALVVAIFNPPNAVFPPPSAPAGVSAVAWSARVSLTWNASPGATNYNVKRSTTSGGETVFTNVTSAGYTDTRVTNGTTYYYDVSALGYGGESANSSEVNATPMPTGTWLGQVTSPPAGLQYGLLLSDGTVICADGGTDWYRLTPDSHGSYLNGTWSQIASMNSSRLFFSSVVLTNGNVYVAGGEYGGGPAELYDSVANQWTVIQPPTENFSDADSKILPSGNVLQSDSQSSVYIYYPGANTEIYDENCGDMNESCWCRLPNDNILAVNGYGTSSEHYVPTLNAWHADNNVPVAVFGYGGELGPLIALPNGKAFQIGATPNTAIYTPGGSLTSAGTWVAGAVMPNNEGAVDAPAAMMNNGNILLAIGPDTGFNGPTSFYEYNYLSNSFTEVTGPYGTDGNPPFVETMLDLPDGTVLFFDGQGTTSLYVYKPAGTPLAQGQPAISSLTQNTDGTYHLTGVGLNGITGGAAYGDDWQMDTSYPLVRLTNNSSSFVYYARTRNWSSTTIQNPNPVTTEFTLPPNLPSGTYSLVVTVMGNVSATVPLTNSPPAAPTGLAAAIGNTQVVLTWYPVTGATSYNVLVATNSGGYYYYAAPTATVAGTSWTNSGLVNGQTLYYVVTAVGGGGVSAYSTELSATPVGAPSVPANFSATAGDTRVALTWSASVGAAGYNVKRATTSGGEVTITNVSGTAYLDAGLTAGTRYYYEVSAVGPNGESANSIEASATPAAQPALQLRMPFTNSAAADGSTSARSDTGGGGINITMNMSTNGAAAFNLHGAAGTGITNAAGANAMALDLTTNTAPTQGTNQPVTVPSAVVDLLGNSTLATIGGGNITNFTATLWIKLNEAYNGGGSDSRLWVLSAGGSGANDINTANGLGLLISNTNQFQLGYPGSGTANFNWPAGSLPVGQWIFLAVTYDGSAYNVYGGTDTNSAQWLGSASVAGKTLALGSTASLSIGNRATDLKRGFNGWVEDFRFYNGPGDPTFIEGVRQSAGVNPDAPTGLSATPGNGQVALAWNPVLDAASYNVKRSTTSGGEMTVTNVSGTSYTDTGLNNGTKYYYEVSALNAGAESANSAEASATPAGPPALQLRMPFTNSAAVDGSAHARSDTGGGGINITMNTSTNGAVAFNLHGAPGTGITNGFGANALALDLTTNVAPTQGVNQPVEATPGGNSTAGAIVDLLGSAPLASLGGGGGNITNFTATLWLKLNTPYDNTVGVGPRLWILNSGSSGLDIGAATSVGLQILTASQFQLGYPGGGKAEFSWPSGSLPVGQWLFVAVTYDSSTYTVYAGTDASPAQSLGTLSLAGQTLALGGTASLAIGNRASDFKRGFNGWVEDFRFYNGSADAAFVESVRQSAGVYGTPTGLSATGTNAAVRLTWNATSGAPSYNLKRSTNRGGPYTIILSSTLTNYSDTGLANGTAYYYVVSAVNAGVESPNSSEAGATPVAPILVLNVPPQSGGQFTLQFSGVDGQSYIVEMTTNLMTGWMPVYTNIQSGGLFIYTDSNPTNAARFYRVQQ
jgi:fibronectin type 3 domain-containing protein